MSVLSWTYFPRNVRPADWSASFLEVVGGALSDISSIDKNGPNSDGVLLALAPGLKALGYRVETGKSKAEKIRLPVLYGENGKESVSYEIDGFHEALGIAVEVEAGRGAQNNADYRDLIRASLILDARYLSLLMPQRYRFTGSPAGGVRAYEASRTMLEAIYASQRLRLPFEGVLLIGY